MILKTLTHDHGESDCWNWYDNIESASAYFDEGADMACVSIKFKGSDPAIVIGLKDAAYLCNDQGQTIEKLLPKRIEQNAKDIHPWVRTEKFVESKH